MVKPVPGGCAMIGCSTNGPVVTSLLGAAGVRGVDGDDGIRAGAVEVPRTCSDQRSPIHHLSPAPVGSGYQPGSARGASARPVGRSSSASRSLTPARSGAMPCRASSPAVASGAFSAGADRGGSVKAGWVCSVQRVPSHQRYRSCPAGSSYHPGGMSRTTEGPLHLAGSTGTTT